MRTAFGTDQGPRENLEDAVHIFAIKHLLVIAWEALVLMVLDGVGGHKGGGVASNLATTEISAYLAAFLAASRTLEDRSGFHPEVIIEALKQSLAWANEAVCERGQDSVEFNGMATTVVCGVIVDERLYLAWAGDSRCYLHRRTSLRQLTRDHKEIEQLIDVGLISREEASTHPLAHSITRYLGHPSGFAASTMICDLQPGDVLLMCSDGLTDVLGNRQIAETITACRVGHIPFEELPRHLIRQALEAGTGDNVTVLCCEYQPDGGLPRSSINQARTAAYPLAAGGVFPGLFKETCNE